MPTEIHKHTCRLIWQNYSTLDIVTELQQKYDILGDAAERELYARIAQLREQIKEAREAAPAAAEQMFRDGLEWAQVITALKAPYLIPSGAAVNAAIAALEKIAAEK